MNEPIPFTLEDWKRLKPLGWRFGINFRDKEKEERRFVGLLSNGLPVWENLDGGPYWSDSNGVHKTWILPPRQVIEFKVGLFSFGLSAPPIRAFVIDSEFNETSRNFIRLLTKDEMRDGVVEI